VASIGSRLPLLNLGIGFSVDPYLCGTLAAETVSGIQEKGVITSIKVPTIHPITQLLETEKEYSITLLMSKKLTAANSITPMVDASKASPLTLTIKPCTNSTYGPFKTLSVLAQVTLCVHTNESITHIPVEIASF
jgi:hypothetical protein